MQPDLPWNVAGIPPEAREAARASARREGLSVGEWLTQRILRTLSHAEPAQAEPDIWRRNAAQYRQAPPPPPSFTQDSEAMLADVSRTELETQNAYKRIEEQLRGVGRRLESAERSQTENSRAMNKAATEINIATREQAQAFDQLSAHVVSLADRLTRMEKDGTNDAMKEAVRGLHQGLSRLAEQISQNANQSANQVATLATNLESVANRLVEARGEAQAAAHALEHRVGAMDDRVRTSERFAQASMEAVERALEKIETSKTETSASDALIRQHATSLAGIETTLGKLDQRMAAAETSTATNDAQAAAVAQVGIKLDKLDARISVSEAQVTAVAQAGTKLDRLDARISASEAQTAGALARLEDNVAHLDSGQKHSEFDRRLSGIEHAISDIAGRLEISERNSAGKAGNVEETLRSLGQRVDAADKRHRDALAELRSAVNDANTKLASFEHPLEAPALAPAAPFPTQPATPFVAQTAPAQPIFDLPPFPEAAQEFPAFNLDHAEHTATQPVFNVAPPVHDTEEQTFADADTFASAAALAEQEAKTPANESFLTAARRSARAAAEPVTAPEPASGFAFNMRRGGAAAAVASDPQLPADTTRYILIGVIALIAVVVVLAGIYFSKMGTHSTVRVPATVTSTAVPPAAPAKTAAANTAPLDAAPAVVPAANQTAQAVAPAPKKIIVQPMRVAVVHDDLPAAPRHTRDVQPRASRLAAPSVVAANTNTAPAQQTLAVTTQPAPQNKLAALANGGNIRAESALGFAYLDGTNGVPVNEAEGARWLERAANAGDPMAAYRLGTLYERGHGVPTDAAKAIQLYGIAANKGNRKAMHNLAVAFADGSGVPKNLQEAAQWFSKAAKLGLSDSQFNLAVLYERGMGVPQSLTEAYKWYAIAAAHGDAESKARVDALATQLAPADRDAAQKAADAFRPEPLNRAANTAPGAGDVVGG